MKVETRTDLRRNGDKRGLIIILIALGMIIVGLVVALIVVGLTGNGTTCLSYIDTDDIQECVGELYNAGQKEEANAVYDKLIDRALMEENYDNFGEFIVGKAALPYLEDDCRAAFEIFGDARIERVPSQYKHYIYDDAWGFALECADTERMNYYQQKMVEIEESGEYDESMEEFYD